MTEHVVLPEASSTTFEPAFCRMAPLISPDRSYRVSPIADCILSIRPLPERCRWMQGDATIFRLRRCRGRTFGSRTKSVLQLCVWDEEVVISKLANLILFLGCLQAVVCRQIAVAEQPVASTLETKVRSYLDERRAEFDQIPVERKSQLKTVASYVKDRVKAGQTARLTFICTHNSRRSHMSQIWAAVAASEQKIRGVETFSGGTEATAFNPRAIAAIERAGLKVDKPDDSKNPKYAVRFKAEGQPLICFSKAYGDSPNPVEEFCAVMTCSQADKACPNVKGCTLRVAIPFEDPKVADGTPEESAKYDERCAQISREMLYLFSQVGN